MSEVDKQQKKQGGVTGKGFVKGKSGNPNGRPKKAKCIPDILRSITSEKADGYETKLHQILDNVVNQAIKGDQWSIQFVADRMEGKPAQVINQTIEELPSGFTTTRL
tara:strand:- start:155 stop:475 length:321 start_codon:yes stop_codon:yes gene_type:complete